MSHFWRHKVTEQAEPYKVTPAAVGCSQSCWLHFSSDCEVLLQSHTLPSALSLARMSPVWEEEGRGEAGRADLFGTRVVLASLAGIGSSPD